MSTCKQARMHTHTHTHTHTHKHTHTHTHTHTPTHTHRHTTGGQDGEVSSDRPQFAQNQLQSPKIPHQLCDKGLVWSTYIMCVLCTTTTYIATGTSLLCTPITGPRKLDFVLISEVDLYTEVCYFDFRNCPD